MQNKATFWLVLTSLLASLSFISGLIRIPIGPVPFTLQTIFVILAGLLLPPFYAVLSQIINFLLLTLFIYGASIFVSPTCGFLLAFILVAWFLAITPQFSLVIRFIIVELLLYLIGLSYLWYILLALNNTTLNFLQVLKIGFIPFIIPDLIKIIIAIALYKRLKPLLDKKINLITP